MHYSTELSYNSSGSRGSTLPFYSDKVLLPQSILEGLIEQQRQEGFSQLPHPLIFRLSTPSSRCYAGVKEFISNEGEIELPGGLVEKLHIASSVTAVPVQVELVDDLPRATSLTLKPYQLYDDLATDQDWKWFLEAKLTAVYTTLTQGDILSLRDEETVGKIYKLQVSKAAPGRTVCIVDTDIDLDIEPIDVGMAKAMSDNKPAETVRLTSDGKPVTVDSTGGRLQLIVPEAKTATITCNMDFATGDRFAGTSRFRQSTVNQGMKELSVTGEEAYIVPLGTEFSEAKFAATYGSAPTTTTTTTTTSSSMPQVDADHVVCSNCGSIISKQSQFMHENFCRRNNIKCSKGCGEVFLRQIPETHWHCCNTYGDTKESLAVHTEYCHDGPVNCTLCGDSLPNKQGCAVHQATECPRAMHECRFCHLVVPRGEPTPQSTLSGMSEHEYGCGSKTTECYKCGKVLRRRDLAAHLRLHEMDRVSKPKPTICSNVNCIRPRGGNILALCDVCFGPLYSTAHDPTHIRLKSRVQRRYIIQLQDGCGHSWCQNKLCKTSNVPNKPKFDSFDDILLAVRTKLVPKDITTSQQYSFCVDEAMTQKESIVELLQLDSEIAQYDRTWICKATNESTIRQGDDMGNVGRVRTYLREHGVKTDEENN